MKKLLLILTVALAASFAPAAVATPEKEEFSPVAEMKKTFAVSGGVTVIDRYVGFSNGAVFFPKPVTYGYLNITHVPSGVFLGVWGSTGFNNRYSDNWDDEVDFTIGWSHDFGPVTLSLSQSYFDCFGVGEMNGNDVWKTDVLLGGKPWKFAKGMSVAPYLEYELYVTDSRSTINGGSVYSIGFVSQLELTSILSLVSNTSVKYDDGGFGLEHGFLIKHSSALEWKVGKNITVCLPEINVWSPLMHDSRNVEHTLGATVRFAFGL